MYMLDGRKVMERMSEEKQENQQAEGQTQAKEYKPTRSSDTLYGCRGLRAGDPDGGENLSEMREKDSMVKRTGVYLQNTPVFMYNQNRPVLY